MVMVVAGGTGKGKSNTDAGMGMGMGVGVCVRVGTGRRVGCLQASENSKQPSTPWSGQPAMLIRSELYFQFVRTSPTRNPFNI